VWLPGRTPRWRLSVPGHRLARAHNEVAGPVIWLPLCRTVAPSLSNAPATLGAGGDIRKTSTSDYWVKKGKMTELAGDGAGRQIIREPFDIRPYRLLSDQTDLSEGRFALTCLNCGQALTYACPATEAISENFPVKKGEKSAMKNICRRLTRTSDKEPRLKHARIYER
jgi:hypothetical protein